MFLDGIPGQKGRGNIVGTVTTLDWRLWMGLVAWYARGFPDTEGSVLVLEVSLLSETHIFGAVELWVFSLLSGCQGEASMCTYR